MTSGPSPVLHLVRHAEVENPRHVVYADLPGFSLSELGRRQATATADHLARRRVALVVASPLERALETAVIVAGPHRLVVETDERLTEWALGGRWAGTPWEDLDARFPEELTAYLEDPETLPFSPEPLDALAHRVAAAVLDAWDRANGQGDVVVVSHQDPIEAGRRRLTGLTFGGFHTAKPGHASVVELVPTIAGWMETAYREPAPGR